MSANAVGSAIPTDRPLSRAPRVRILVIAFEAESTIAAVLDRMPTAISGAAVDVQVADDASTDATADVARRWVAERRHPIPVEVVQRDRNLGYGGTQKAGFRQAIDDGMDAIAVLHGDGQYPPELIPDLLSPITGDGAAAAFGSRMINSGAARSGGMPLTRRLGNRALSRVQNWLTRASLTEWHSGFRAYSTEALRQVDLDTLPDDFSFDTAITLRLLDRRSTLVEIPIPTRYGDEVSRIPLARTGIQILRLTSAHRLRRRTEPTS